MHEDITHDMHTLKNDTGSIAALTLSPEAVSVMRFILRFFFCFFVFRSKCDVYWNSVQKC